MKKQSLAQKLLALLLVFVLSGVLALPVFAEEANGGENGYEYENGYEGEENGEYDEDIAEEDYDADEEHYDADEEDGEDADEDEEEEYVEIEPITAPIEYVLTVEVDGVEVEFIDQGPIMADNRVLVPVRGAFDAMGFDEPGWNRSTREATLTRGDVEIIIPADGTTFTVNGETVTPDVPQRMLNNRLMLPLSAIADAVGATHEWDGTTQTAHIFTVVEEEPVEEEPAEDEEYDYDEVEEYDEDADEEDYDYDEDEAAADDDDAEDGFVLYTSSAYGFSIYHPAPWVVVDAQGLEGLRALAALLQMDDELIAALEGGTDAAVTWFDPTNATPTFMATASITVSEALDLTVEMLRDEGAKALLDELLNELLQENFDNFERTGGIVGLDIGDNYFILLDFTASSFGGDASFFQATTVVGDKMYMFTFVTPLGALDIELFKSMLATFSA